MLGLRVKSALFIDYENVSSLCPADAIERWVAWLEDGKFDNGRKRTLLQKRIYWNPSALKHEQAFRSAGFSTVLCEKFAKLKNGADITIALDVGDMIRDRDEIREFILFTTDTDFVPVLKKLRVKGRQTAVLVNENQAQVYGTYRRHADIVIPVRLFEGAAKYNRPAPRLRIADAVRQVLARLQQSSATAEQDPLEAAEEHVIRVIALRPNAYTAARAIERELAKIPGFSKRGNGSYCGTESYRALISELARRNDRIRVDPQPYGGIGVRYVPKDEE